MHAHDLTARNGQQAEGIMIAQIAFFGKGQQVDILRRADILRFYTALIHLAAIERHVVIHMPHQRAQALALKLLDFIPRQPLGGQNLLIDHF